MTCRLLTCVDCCVEARCHFNSVFLVVFFSPSAELDVQHVLVFLILQDKNLHLLLAAVSRYQSPTCCKISVTTYKTKYNDSQEPDSQVRDNPNSLPKELCILGML